MVIRSLVQMTFFIYFILLFYFILFHFIILFYSFYFLLFYFVLFYFIYNTLRYVKIKNPIHNVPCLKA